jgi:hypothetical protein
MREGTILIKSEIVSAESEIVSAESESGSMESGIVLEYRGINYELININ